MVRLECPRCTALFESQRMFTGCPRCREQHVAVNLGVKGDLAPLARLRTERFPATPRGLWRFRALVPVGGGHPVTLGEDFDALLAVLRESYGLDLHG